MCVSRRFSLRSSIFSIKIFEVLFLTFNFLTHLELMFGSVRPHGLPHSRLPCPSPTPRACSNSCPLSQWCHPTVSSSVIPFSSCLQSFPALGSLRDSIWWCKLKIHCHLFPNGLFLSFIYLFIYFSIFLLSSIKNFLRYWLEFHWNFKTIWKKVTPLQYWIFLPFFGQIFSLHLLESSFFDVA